MRPTVHDSPRSYSQKVLDASLIEMISRIMQPDLCMTLNGIWQEGIEETHMLHQYGYYSRNEATEQAGCIDPGLSAAQLGRERETKKRNT